MVIPADSQIECVHSIGLTTKGHVAFLISLDNYKEEFKAGGVQFEFCPWCAMPVPQILG
jgi:hypothetical protein